MPSSSTSVIGMRPSTSRPDLRSAGIESLAARRVDAFAAGAAAGVGDGAAGREAASAAAMVDMVGGRRRGWGGSGKEKER